MEIPQDVAYEALYYTLAFALGSLGGTLATFLGRSRNNIWDVLAAGVLGGLLGSACIMVIATQRGGIIDNELRYLGIAIFVGCGGKYSLRIAYAVIDAIAIKLGIENADTPRDDREDDGST